MLWVHVFPTRHDRSHQFEPVLPVGRDAPVGDGGSFLFYFRGMFFFFNHDLAQAFFANRDPFSIAPTSH